MTALDLIDIIQQAIENTENPDLPVGLIINGIYTPLDFDNVDYNSLRVEIKV